MKMAPITMVRVYLTEGESKLQALIKRLHDWEHVRGVTVFRGISGFGKSGVMHSASLVDMSLNLPVVVEFFDDPDRVEIILGHLAAMLDPSHIVSWPANIMVDETDPT
ncbi:MAG: DUF190 domain-containing protein [Gammaproteobacteria bacterium]|nr:DUF190 domain-containing protein [Gammaproteobacteria bacterium]